MIGTSLDAIHLCSTTPYPNFMFQLTRFMSIMPRTWHITITRYATSFFSRHHERPILRAIDATSDKRSQVVWLPNPLFFFFFFIFFEKNILMRPSGTDLILWNTCVSMFHIIAELGFCGAMLTAYYSHQLTTYLSMIFTSSAVASWARHLFLGRLRDGVPSLLTRDHLRWASRSLPAAQPEVRECNVSCSLFRLIENKV
jgi:hypothetical protein